ncbi:MAG TPA: FkbM family methyltransferase [Terriglobales bacterium]|nr:FkbM family methyltransferase [Terriglobales bacterium]
MIKKLARFGNDTYYLLRTPHSAGKKLEIWLNRVRPSGKMLGFDITYFDRPSLLNLYREIFVRQHYYFRANSESPVILDCGANMGMATLYFKWLYPKARIEAFEPDPTTFAVLKRNVDQNQLRDVVVHNCALWLENGEIEFFVDHTTPGSPLMSTDRSRLKGKAIQVQSRRLSDFISGPIDFLKLDVEGSEHRVLCDLLSSGKAQFIRQMVVEYHHHIGDERSCMADFLAQLERAGFDYQIHASLFPVTSKGIFQDMLIGAYRTEPNQGAVGPRYL